MKMISVENVRNFISELEDILYALHLENKTWHKFHSITELYFGKKISEIINDGIIEEIAIVWHIEDVQSVRPNLTDAQASKVLRSLKKNHDANEGISWITIEVMADILFPENITTLSKENV